MTVDNNARPEQQALLARVRRRQGLGLLLLAALLLLLALLRAPAHLLFPPHWWRP